jgi:hypothetical protein
MLLRRTMKTIQDVNARLAALGYRRDEARVDENGSPERLRLSGTLLNETTADHEDMRRIAAMLPSKAELYAYRVVAGLPVAGRAS